MHISRPRTTDDGFGLIEMIVAMGIASAVFLALAVAGVTSIKATLVSRQVSQAADVLDQAVESARALNYDAVQMSTSDATVGADTRINQSTQTFDAGNGAEPLVMASTSPALLSPHKSTVVRNGTTYTRYTYVTTVNDANGAYKRFTAIVDWKTSNLARSRQQSTFLVSTVRGLPLPRFSLTATGSTTQVKGNGTQLVYGFKLTNLGARDAWNVASSPATPGWTYYVDTNRNGFLDTGEPVVGDSNGDGVPDTGLIDPNTPIYVLAVRTLGAGDNNSLVTTSFTATSIAQPAASTAAKTVGTYQACVGSAVCPAPTPSGTPSPTPSPTASPTPTPTSSCASACTSKAYYLRVTTANYDEKNSFGTEPIEELTSTASTRSAQLDFSKSETGVGANGFGRYIHSGGLVTTNDPTMVGDWRLPLGSTAYTFNGTSSLTMYVRCQTAGSPTVGVFVGTSAGKTTFTDFTTKQSATATLTGCSTTSYTPYTVALPSASFTGVANSYLTLKLTTSADLRVDFDNTTSPSALSLAQVSP